MADVVHHYLPPQFLDFEEELDEIETLNSFSYYINEFNHEEELEEIETLNTLSYQIEEEEPFPFFCFQSQFSDGDTDKIIGSDGSEYELGVFAQRDVHQVSNSNVVIIDDDDDGFVQDPLFRVSDVSHEMGSNQFELGLGFDGVVEEEDEENCDLGLGVVGFDGVHEEEDNDNENCNFGLGFEGVHEEEDNDDDNCDFGLGLGLGFEGVHEEEDNDEENCDFGLGFDGVQDDNEYDDNGGFMVTDCGDDDDFFVGRRTESSVVEPFGDGVRVVGIGSDSDEDVDEEGDGCLEFHGDDDLECETEDFDPALCWDCLHIEDQHESNEEFEWEEVINREGEGDVLNMIIDGEEERTVSIETTIRNLDWEVLLGNYGRMNTSELEHDDYDYPTEYEMLFGQFTENEQSQRGSPPTARSFVEKLPSFCLTQEDVDSKNALCAVCKDDISVEEEAKLLPCSHYYHGDCILPWLNIRNTCPVCRFELPTDDTEYERQRIERDHRNVSGESQVRHDFEIFPSDVHHLD
ncbi:hypothetical protein GIB67_007201 [Kingdonia uniflora]|uniref:RING-type E3 ubiquitin transferase n=1 Tax=Kingdonia uniflora TaxID=39325 RepID=A0A7J7NX88_9MAGN|nr:hypothetical protein GIB67_007201 [Kingdonia uniflora]